MRKSLLLMSAAALALAVPAMAQDTSSSFKSPPAPNSGQTMPMPTNSAPPGTATSTDAQTGNLGTTPTAPMASQPGMAQPGMAGQDNMTGMQPMRHPHHHYMAHRKKMNEEAGDVTRETGGGAGEPASRHPSNIDRDDTRSDIAPALPMPPVRGNSPEAYLAAANRALDHHQGGEAQEALERAETRLLDRSVPAGQGNMPERDPRLAQIHDARMALANRDWSAARQSIQQAMNMRGGSMGGAGMGMDHGNMGQGQMMDRGNMGQGHMMGEPAMQPGMMAPPSGTMAPPPGTMAPPPAPGMMAPTAPGMMAPPANGVTQ